MKYGINLVEELRNREIRHHRKAALVTYAIIALAGILTIVILKTVLFLLSVNQDLTSAKTKLTRLQEEYQRYQQTAMSINKEDLELLDRLQHGRIFWTKKLSAMAFPLPSNYWVNSFQYKGNALQVKGFGYVEEEQRQLITLDDYLNILRADSIFNKDMKQVSLIETRRDDVSDSAQRDRVSFEFTAQPGTNLAGEVR
jgi:Tfp pilus assembly protein PilN